MIVETDMVTDLSSRFIGELEMNVGMYECTEGTFLLYVGMNLRR